MKSPERPSLRALGAQDLLAMERLTVGERIRMLRRRQYPTQAIFCQAMGDLTGWRPSAAWLSGVESDALALTDERRGQVATALGLDTADWHVLDGAMMPPGVTPALRRYAGWQSVRLALASELLRDRKLHTSERSRARAVRDRLRDCIEADQQLFEASNKRPGQLTAFVDLPDVTRWLLIIEAAFMDPFLPWQPIAMGWATADLTTLQALAEELGLSSETDELQLIEHVRRTSVKGMDWLRNVEPKSARAELPGVLSASDAYWNPQDDARVLRGGALVGALGWNFVAGAYLARSWPTSSTSTSTHTGLDSQSDQQLDDSTACPSGTVPAILVQHRGAEHGGSRQQPRRAKSIARPGHVADFLVRLGPAVIARDLAKLRTVYRLQALETAGQDWLEVERFPTLSKAEENRTGLVVSLEVWLGEQQKLEREGSVSLESANAILKLLKATAVS